ncbi:hypothetical protein [Pseudoflavonifractor capillosus]|nr:hypothetical protein [Pseudoflavonifractor capillosus]
MTELYGAIITKSNEYDTIFSNCFEEEPTAGVLKGNCCGGSGENM